MHECKPLYLFADSQLLFWKSDSSNFFSSIRKSLGLEGNTTKIRAAYIGASNGDKVEFYELFQSAMEGLNICQTMMIHSPITDKERIFLQSADLILLSGGDVKRGCDAFSKSGLDKIINDRYYAGAVIIGISAGAIQLGMGDYRNEQASETLKLIPYYIDVHNENDNWHQLNRVVKDNAHSKGYGIPSGGGMIVHPDFIVEPIRQMTYEFDNNGSNNSSTNILLPPDKALSGGVDSSFSS